LPSSTKIKRIDSSRGHVALNDSEGVIPRSPIAKQYMNEVENNSS